MKHSDWPTRSALYVAVGGRVSEISRLSSGRTLPSHARALELIGAIANDLRGSVVAPAPGPSGLARPLRAALEADDASTIWSASCPDLPSKAALLVDRIYLALDIPPSRRDEFTRLACERMFPARHRAFRTSWRAKIRDTRGHLLRVSYQPKARRHRFYAQVDLAPPLLFDPRWRDRVGATVVRCEVARLRDLLALAADVRVARLEIAVDIAFPAWALQAIRETSRRFIVSPRHDRARTIESGSRISPISLSCYDKANQLRNVWRLDLGHELIRIEVRVKLDEPLPLADLALLANPFEDVTVHLLEPARDAAAGFKIVVRAARLLGLTRLYRAHRWVTLKSGRRKVKPLPRVLDRARYLGLLAATEVAPSTWRAHPRSVFARRWRLVADELLRALRSAGSCDREPRPVSTLSSRSVSLRPARRTQERA